MGLAIVEFVYLKSSMLFIAFCLQKNAVHACMLFFMIYCHRRYINNNVVKLKIFIFSGGRGTAVANYSAAGGIIYFSV